MNESMMEALKNKRRQGINIKVYVEPEMDEPGEMAQEMPMGDGMPQELPEMMAEKKPMREEDGMAPDMMDEYSGAVSGLRGKVKDKMMKMKK